MPTPILPYRVDRHASSEPGVSVSDSLNVIFPGISISKRCVFLHDAKGFTGAVSSGQRLYPWATHAKAGLCGGPAVSEPRRRHPCSSYTA